MKRRVLLGFLSAHALLSYSQSFTAISGSVPEYIQPVSSSGIPDVTQHVSCYSFSNLSFLGGALNDFYVWGFSGVNTIFGGSGTGISWKRTNPGGAVLDSGTIAYSQKWYMEVGLLRVGSEVSGSLYVVAAYYDPGRGHMYDLYRWDATTLTYLSTDTLSTSTIGTRISMDSHLLYGVALTWHDGTDLKVKFIEANVGGITAYPDVIVDGASNAFSPDIAFAHAEVPVSALKVRIAYMDETGSAPFNIVVKSREVSSLTSGGTVPFVTDDIAPLGLEHVNVNLDCPDHSVIDKWSYVFTRTLSGVTPQDFNIIARVKNSGGPITCDLTTPGSLSTSIKYDVNLNPSLAYSPDGTRIHYVWSNSNVTTPTILSRYVHVSYTDAGIKIGALDDYKIVSPLVGTYPIITLSKQNDRSRFLFPVYSVMREVPYFVYDIRHKFINWTVPVFKPNDFLDIASSPDIGDGIKVNPNPFDTDFVVDLKEADDGGKYELFVYDITGKLVLHKTELESGTKHKIDGSQLSSGTYTVTVKDNNSSIVKSFVVVKK